MNPCPCGFYNHPDIECVCGPGIVQKYLNRISGPLMDRIDMHVEVVPVPIQELSRRGSGRSSESIRGGVIKAREMQTQRYSEDEGTHCNAQMQSRHIRDYCVLDDAGREMLSRATERLNLSARAYDRILKVSRTIADMEGSADIHPEHVAEAINYRSLDRERWGE